MGVRWTTYILLVILVVNKACSSLNPEGLALLDFRVGVSQDPYDIFASWNSDDHNPCLWSNVFCVDNNVQVLDLNGLSLEGVLAPELGNLTHLRRLVLSQNRFTGTIPKELGELKMLEVLDLRDNYLSGIVPLELGTMPSLKRLLLGNNKLKMELVSLNALPELQFDDKISFGVANGMWQRGFELAKKADSVRMTIKETVFAYLNPFQMFGKGSSDICYINEESPSEPKTIQNIQNDVNIIRRMLAEESINLMATPSSRDVSTPNQIIALPSSRSSGSFPAVQKKRKHPTISVPSHVEAPGPSMPTIPKNNPDSENVNNTDKWKIILGVCSGAFMLISAISFMFICRSRAVVTLAPWKSGLSGQLQKAFITGVLKLNRMELETACEEYSNIIETKEGCMFYKGTLSSGVEICVAATTITRLKDWSKRAEIAFRKKIDMLSRINHKNFVNLIGYCEEDEPFVRMMVFEYAPNGTLSEHLHIQELEHLDWGSRMRVIMGIAYCLDYMHELNPPVPHSNLSSSMVYLTDDYAAKVAELSFWKDLLPKTKSEESEAEHSKTPLLSDTEANVYSFGILLLEIITGRFCYSNEQGSLITWAARYLNGKQSIDQMVDPTLKSFDNDQLEVLSEVIKECIQDARKRPTIKEIIAKLEVLGISPKLAVPRLSPLWWAELEIVSSEAD